MPTNVTRTLGSDIFSEMDAEPEIPATSEVPLTLPGKAGWMERAERTKPTKPELVKPIVEPPEIVSVEMTPEEQDVYALMGVSPLVHLERQVNKSKPVIINVILPGQLSDQGTWSETDELVSSSTMERAVPVEHASESLLDTLDEPSPEMETTDENEVNSSGVFINRRRRRRPSASEGSV